jgi:hypothetical protein
VGSPVTVFTTELEEKDVKPVFQKKLVLATCALGAAFADRISSIATRSSSPPCARPAASWRACACTGAGLCFF